jgi:hypothetical protein
VTCKQVAVQCAVCPSLQYSTLQWLTLHGATLEGAQVTAAVTAAGTAADVFNPTSCQLFMLLMLASL